MANVNVIIDEAASLGPNMGCIEDAINIYRGFGIKLHLFYQSPAQLKKCFPGEQDQTVLANVSQVYFAVNDSSAENISNRLGDQTIVVESWGESVGHSSQSSSGGSPSSYSRSWNSNSNLSQMSRKLLKPEEILSLDKRIAITFVPGQRPIWTILDRYYEKQGNPSQLEPAKLLGGACYFALLGALCLLATFNIWREAENVQANWVEKSWSRDVGRSQENGGARENGTRQRFVQRQRLRSVRRGTTSGRSGTR